jgi:hypothetical protein
VQAAVKAHRLVTLTGVGGVGKTHLAVEVAARLVDEFPDGVWFFELAGVTDPAAIPDAVAAVLGITQQPGKTVTDGGVPSRRPVRDRSDWVAWARVPVVSQRQLAVCPTSSTLRMRGAWVSTRWDYSDIGKGRALSSR